MSRYPRGLDWGECEADRQKRFFRLQTAEEAHDKEQEADRKEDWEERVQGRECEACLARGQRELQGDAPSEGTEDSELIKTN